MDTDSKTQLGSEANAEPGQLREIEVQKGRLSNHSKILLLAFVSGLPTLAFMIYAFAEGNYSGLSIFTLGVLSR